MDDDAKVWARARNDLATLDADGADGATFAMAAAKLAAAMGGGEDVEADAWLEVAEQRARTQLPPTHAAVRRLFGSLGRRANLRGDVEAALLHWQACAAACPDDAARVEPWTRIGELHRILGRLDAAATVWGEAADAADAHLLPDRWDLLHRLARLAIDRGRASESLIYADRAQAAVADANGLREIADAQAEALGLLGRWADAVDRRRAALDLLDESDPADRADAWLDLARACARAGQRAEAERAGLESLALRREDGDPASLADAHDALARIGLAADRRDAAALHFARAHAVRTGQDVAYDNPARALAAVPKDPRAAQWVGAMAPCFDEPGLTHAAKVLLAHLQPGRADNGLAIACLVRAGMPPWPHEALRMACRNAALAAAPFGEELMRVAGARRPDDLGPAIWHQAAERAPESAAAWADLDVLTEAYGQLAVNSDTVRQAAWLDAGLISALDAIAPWSSRAAALRSLVDVLGREEFFVAHPAAGWVARARIADVAHIGQLLTLLAEAWRQTGRNDAPAWPGTSALAVAHGERLPRDGDTFRTSWVPYAWPALSTASWDPGDDTPGSQRHRLGPERALADLPRFAGRRWILVIDTAPMDAPLPPAPKLRASVERIDFLSGAEASRWLARVRDASGSAEVAHLDAAAWRNAAAEADASGDRETVHIALSGALHASRNNPLRPLAAVANDAQALGYALLADGSATEAAALLNMARDLWIEAGHGDADPVVIDASIACLQAYQTAKMRTDGRRLIDALLRAATQRPGANGGILASVHRAAANWEHADGRHAAAIAHYDQAATLLAAGPDRLACADTLRDLARAQASFANQPEVALATWSYALAARREALGDGHMDVATDLREVAELYGSLGRDAEADACREVARDLLAASWYASDATGLAAMAADLDAHVAAGEADEALWLARRANAVAKQVWGPGQPDSADAAARLIDLLVAVGRDDEVVDVAQREADDAAEAVARAWFLGAAADAALRLGDALRAGHAVASMHELATSWPEAVDGISLLQRITAVHVVQGEWELALARSFDALRAAEGQPARLAEVERAIAGIHTARGDTSTATRAIARALAHEAAATRVPG